MPVYIDRDTFSQWNGEVIGQQAKLVQEDIAAAPPLPAVESPSPPPAPAQPAFQPPTPSDSLTQPVPRATPGPPALTDLLAAAGLAESPSPSAGGAVPPDRAGTAPAPSGGIPSLDSLLQSAGLGDVGGAVGGAVSGAAQTVASAAPPPLADLMRSAGLLDTPKPAQVVQAAPTAATAAPGGGLDPNTAGRPSQFRIGLSDADAYAACGPAAAIAFARAYGRNPTGPEALELARQVGWTQQQGMAGVQSEKALLDKMGIATRLEQGVDWNHVTQDALNGNPIVLDTPGHYYFIDGSRQRSDGTQEYHVGTSGTDLRGGREWMTSGEINGMPQSGGAVRAALYADNPQTPHPSVANASQSATQTTAGLSGGGALSGQIGDRGQQIMSGAAQAASWLGDQGQKALQAVLMTEGGLNNARGDNGQSVGPLQFYTGGQLANLAQQMGMGLEQAKTWVEQNPVAAVQWAIGTPDKPGYLGAAIQKGLQAGLQGADLATYAQRHGQVSVSPERAGQNFAAMFGGGQGVIQGAVGAVQGAGQAAQNTFADLAQSGGNLAQQGAALTQGLTRPLGESPTAAIEREATQRMAALQATLNTTLQGGQQAQDQRSVQASTLGGGLAGRGAVNVTDAGGGLTPEQIAGDTTLPVSPENQSLNAQIRGPLGPAPLIQQPPSSGAADATLDVPAGAQSLGAASQMFPTWSQDARSAVLTSDIPRGPAQGTPLPPADYTTASLARPAEPPKPLWAQIGDTIGAAISQGLQPLVQAFQGGPTPAPEGGGYGAAGPMQPGEAAAALAPIGEAAANVAQSPFMPTNLTNTALQAVGQNVVAPALEAIAQPGGLLAGPRAAAADALEGAAANVPDNVPVVAGALRGVAGMVGGPTLVDQVGMANDLAKKYPSRVPGLPDFNVMSPEDRAQWNNLTLAIGGVEMPTPPGEGSLAEVAGNINLVKYPTEVQEVIQAAAPTIPESATRGVVPDAVMRDLAQMAGTTVPDVVSNWRPGQAQNAETIYALRDALANQGRQVLEAQQALRANPQSADAQASLVQALTEHRAVQEVVQGTTAEAGRALRQFTQPVEGTIAALQQLQTLAAKTGQSPAELAQQLATMDLSDPVHMGDLAKVLNPPRLPPSEALGPSGPQPGQLPFGAEFGQELPTVAPISPMAQEARGTAERQPGQLGLGMGEQFQQDLVAPSAGNFEPPKVPTPVQTPEQADQLRRALTLKALRDGTPLPDIPYQGPTATNLRGAPAGIPPEADQPGLGIGEQYQRGLLAPSAGNFEVPNVPTPAETPAQADYLRRALTLKALQTNGPLPDIPYPTPVRQVADRLGATTDPSRAFDLNALRDVRRQYQTEQAPLIQTSVKVTPLDRFIGYTAANMLSGIGTAVQNTLGNFGSMVARPAFTAAAGHPLEALRDVAAMSAELSDAFAAYGRTFQTGQRAAGHYQAPILTGPLAPLSVPMRNLAATDEFFRTLNGAGAAAAEASRRLRENPSLSFDEVLQKHANDIVEAGADGAARAVYEKGGGLAGWFGEWVGQNRTRLLRSDDPREVAMGIALQWLMPMTRVPGVILGEGIRSLPVVNEATGLTRATRAIMRGDHYDAQQELGRTILTSFVNTAILSEVAQGNITGDGPTSPADKARLQEAVDKDGNAVWRPNSVRLPGGRWLDYSGLGPISLSMSSIANLVDTATDYAQKPPEQRGDMPQLAKELLNREARTIGNAWYLKGLADVLSGIKEGTIGGTASSITQLADRLVPAESLMNELRRMEDPYARDPQNVVQREESRLPFASRLVQPRLTATTGQPEEQPRDLVATLLRGTPGGMMTPNPVATEIARLTDAGERVTVPYEQKTYAGAQQTPEQQRTIREQTGDAVRLYVLNTMNQPAYARLTDAQKADALKKAVSQAQEASNITLSGQVARSPHEAALMQWAQVPQYSGVSSRLPPEQIARANWEIEQARSKLSDYRKQYGEQAENRLRRDDPTAYRLSQRDRIDKEVLNRRRKAIDRATGGALTQAADTAATGGLVGVGGTVVRP